MCFIFKELFILLLFSFSFNPARGSLSFLDLYFWRISATISSSVSSAPSSLTASSASHRRHSLQAPISFGGWRLSIFRFPATCLSCNPSALNGSRKLGILLFIVGFVFFIIRVGETLFLAFCILGGSRTPIYFREMHRQRQRKSSSDTRCLPTLSVALI